MSSLVKIQKEKSAKSNLIKYEINRINMISNKSLEQLDVVRTSEMKNLEEINFKIVIIERKKNNLKEFKMNVLDTELKEKIETLQKKRNEARKILKEVNQSESNYNEQDILKIAKIIIK